jgi:hypothetical protein
VWGFVVSTTPLPLYPLERDPVIGLQEAGCGLDVKEKSYPPPLPGFEPRTVHDIASRYTDYVIPAARISAMLTKIGIQGQIHPGRIL